MKGIYRLALSFSIILIFLLALWFRSEHLDHSAHPDNDSIVQQKAFNELQAEDLVMTIELFLQQVKLDLAKWQEDMEEDPALRENWLNEQINDHPHIDGFTAFSMPSKEKLYEKGSLPEDAIDKLFQGEPEINGWTYSQPYISQGSKKMVLGLTKDNHCFVSEVDISFVEKYVKELASLSDNNGNFFIGDSQLDVSFSDEEAEVDELSVVKKIPELDWGLYLSSEQEFSSKDHLKKGEVVVVLDDDIDPEKWSKEHEVFLLDYSGNSAVVRDLTRDAEEMMEEWYGDPTVVYMEPNYTFEKQTIAKETNLLPDDEFYNLYQWNLKQLHVEGAWSETIGSDIPVAIVDSGVDPSHPDLEKRIVKGYNAFEDNEAFVDDNGHGTHVAGIFGAVTNNGEGIAGVTWSNPILAVKVLDHEAIGNSFSIAKGIRWATDNGARVINLSLGDEHRSEVMHQAIKYAYERDVVLIAATGNDNVETPMYPAAFEEVLAVGSINDLEERSFFSNYGKHTDVTAPGEHIPSTFVGGQFVMMSGTSMASPHVAGLAALILSRDETLTNSEVYDIIRSTAFDLGKKGFDQYYGYGTVNASEALKQ
ncbi:peptidase S8 [Salipaludibacillus keqinensis]|uniref:Peptidase S8 n=1 Tax=Salipaludibacillus keqinensis TaxID=2045207 RepID=A0A323TLF7_9BACI|nr:S8 family peptidase [Salipaludibacillus keqinensis]PYZ94587.1 peptidase S8 [Salipaludibacillus keqinensis]